VVWTVGEGTVVRTMLPAGAVLVGLVLLVLAADRFVVAAEVIALRRRWSPAVIGAVVVGFGTSLPELVTSVVAAWSREPALALGNAAGSNVANLTLVLGVAVLARPLLVARGRSSRDLVLASAAGLLTLALAVDGQVGAVDGIVLVGALALAVLWQVRAATGARLEVPTPPPGHHRTAWWAIAGLLGVLLGAQSLVWGASELAEQAGVPPIVVGSVLVAIGTSLPELATAIASARRGQSELLIGNLFGSNTFNILGVVGASAVVGAARGEALPVDTAALAVVAAAAVTTIGIGLLVALRDRIGRVAAVLVLVGYLASVPALLAIS
jgi:cation:H+ antiporter